VTTTVAEADVHVPPGAEQAAAEVAASLATVGHAIFALMQPGPLDEIRPLGAPAGHRGPVPPSPATEPVEDLTEPVEDLIEPSRPEVPLEAVSAEPPGLDAASEAIATSIPVPTSVPVPGTVADPEPVSAADEVPAYRTPARSTLSMLNEISFLDD
jgi:hypothetical protein